VLQALDISSSDKVFSITSGGDNSLAILSRKPRLLDVLDTNPAQNHLFELKMVALKNMAPGHALQFLGYRKSNTRDLFFHVFKNLLGPAAKAFWDANQHLVRKGIVHSGKFEKYLGHFRDIMLPMIHSRKRVKKLLAVKTPGEQLSFYQDKWNTWRWKAIYHLFFNEFTMKRQGRGQGMFDHNTRKGVASHYLEKTRTAFTKPSLFGNFYLQYILLSKYPEQIPDYLSLDCIKGVKTAHGQVNIHSAGLMPFLKQKPDNFYTAFNLSDVFEPMTEKESDESFQEIFRVSQNGARVLFWNNLVKRDVPRNLEKHFVEQVELEGKRIEEDRVFFYDSFKIYKISK
jgi:S-adenosylmethionine-diacylglycerol 3-amino-3-carboxypropyl transferase